MKYILTTDIRTRLTMLVIFRDCSLTCAILPSLLTQSSRDVLSRLYVLLTVLILMAEQRGISDSRERFGCRHHEHISLWPQYPPTGHISRKPLAWPAGRRWCHSSFCRSSHGRVSSDTGSLRILSRDPSFERGVNDGADVSVICYPVGARTRRCAEGNLSDNPSWPGPEVCLIPRSCNV